MKALLLAGIVGIGFALTGCDTYTSVDRHHHGYGRPGYYSRSNVYRGRGYDRTRVVVRGDRDRDYDRRRVVVRGDRDRDYGRRNVVVRGDRDYNRSRVVVRDNDRRDIPRTSVRIRGDSDDRRAVRRTYY